MKKELEGKIALTTFSALQKSSGPDEDTHILQSLLKTLSNKNKSQYMDGVLDALKNLFDKEKGIVKAHITVAERLTEEEKSNLKSIIKKEHNALDVQIEEKVDQRILGGIHIKIGEQVFDATIKNKLTQLASKLQVK